MRIEYSKEGGIESIRGHRKLFHCCQLAVPQHSGKLLRLLNGLSKPGLSSTGLAVNF
jgi:hypothetical protein